MTVVPYLLHLTVGPCLNNLELKLRHAESNIIRYLTDTKLLHCEICFTER